MITYPPEIQHVLNEQDVFAHLEDETDTVKKVKAAILVELSKDADALALVLAIIIVKMRR